MIDTSLPTPTAIEPLPNRVHAAAGQPPARWACLAGLEPLPAASQAGMPLAAARSPLLSALQALLTFVSIVSFAVIAGSIALSIGPRLAPFETFIVLSGSMEPLIRLGAVEVVRPVPPETLQVGDIITYQRIEEPQVTVTHRLTQITPAEVGPVVRTKGDVNDSEDPWDLQLRGTAWKHVFSVPYAGYVFVFAQTATGRFVTLVLPAAILAALWLREIWRGRRPVDAPV